MKKDDHKDKEYAAALSLLDPQYHALYDEAEKKETATAKFAKAVDKITPDIFDYLTPAHITLERFKYFVGTDNPDTVVETIIKHKRPHMLWNPFMTEFHVYLLGKIAERLGARKPE